MAWGKSQPKVKALVLEGSLAKQQDVDDLSDLDINIWYDGDVHYGKNRDWLVEIGDVLIDTQLHMETPAGNIATQLVLFQNGVKVDFSFWPISLLDNPFPYYEKLEILLDKDQYADKIQLCLLEKKWEPITNATFDQIVNEFWFELHYVAKFIKREDIWFVQDIQAGIRENYLLPLLEEKARIEGQEISFSGRKIEKWTSKPIVSKFPAIFADYTVASNWQAMWEEITLFEEVSHFIASTYHFRLPTVKIEGMKALLLKIQED
ncbi:hypothetical protein PWEIH_17033 [Listeria weihenstephanensis FSL R9-0317]|uniref:aminoglycoside 6-adenylyltransferase n=1 Tax=Listeria weihenstephanensis TaxID=1006155 RepID=UPI0003E8BC0C|nr:aminoglycoside 6-adenylyltransferase [Listeria weihenstephanensis]EUJ34437.1 hypothetical protein PWEIH_17033 [Listeria weihenstephanensis FSL R9-0317]